MFLQGGSEASLTGFLKKNGRMISPAIPAAKSNQ
jgi:hypothetical protein